MPNSEFLISKDKSISPDDLTNLFASVGFGNKDAESVIATKRSLEAYPFIAYCRDASNHLIGYISAFSDGSFSTFIGELVVRPEFQHQGIGTKLLKAVVDHYSGIPIYAIPFKDGQEFYLKNGFKTPKREMAVVSSINRLQLFNKS